MDIGRQPARALKNRNIRLDRTLIRNARQYFENVATAISDMTGHLFYQIVSLDTLHLRKHVKERANGMFSYSAAYQSVLECCKCKDGIEPQDLDSDDFHIDSNYFH